MLSRVWELPTVGSFQPHQNSMTCAESVSGVSPGLFQTWVWKRPVALKEPRLILPVPRVPALCHMIPTRQGVFQLIAWLLMSAAAAEFALDTENVPQDSREEFLEVLVGLAWTSGLVPAMMWNQSNMNWFQKQLMGHPGYTLSSKIPFRGTFWQRVSAGW